MQKHIALIEDDPLQRLILKRMLDQQYTIHSYHDCEHALQILGQEKDSTPQAILCDLQLPDGDGFALCEKLQQFPHLAECPFIFLSGLNDDRSQKRAASLGVDDFLQKPITKQELLFKLNQSIIRKQKMQAETEAKMKLQVQEPLRPFLPPVIGPYCLSIRSDEQTMGGGDFVFHVKHPHGMDYIFIGDVMGHGTPAKYFMHAYVGYLYGLLQATRHYDQAPRPCDILHELNRTMHDDPFLQRWLMTCLVLGIAPDGKLSYASAGHPPPWLVDTHNAHRLNSKGVIPGLSPNAAYHDTAITLEKDQCLLLKTDGLKLNPSLVKHALGKVGPKGLIDHLFCTAKTADDTTAVLIQRWKKL